MKFFKLQASVEAGDIRDCIIADLAELGFDAFMETDSGFEAAISKDKFTEINVDEVFGHYSSGGSLSYLLEEVEQQNWNKLWESNYDMIEVSEDCLVRASFHKPEKAYRYELIITPKMSFGTGHHATTRLMLLHQLMLEHKDLKVFDAGCGTGVLAIMAMKLGAASADACDIEEWAIENARENVEANNATVNVQQGTASDFARPGYYDLVLANINRNIIIEEMPVYASMLKTGGTLLLSGFYLEDLSMVANAASEQKLRIYTEKNMTNWGSLGLRKEG